MNPRTLIDSGLALIPVPVGKKSPSVKGWNLHENVITTVEELHKLKNKNIGLAHAYCTPTVTCAIDVDDCRQANKWLLTQHVDLKALLLGKDSVVIWSGKNNSVKLLYRLPANVGALPSKQIKSEDQTMMLEFRCATSGSKKTVQDLLPPSRHPSGSTYRWMGEGNPLQIPTIPECLLTIWLGIIGDGKKKDRGSPSDNYLKTPHHIAHVKEMLSYCNADCSYFTYRDLCWALLSTGWDCAVSLAKEWSQTAPERFNEIVFNKLVESYESDIEGGLTLGTVYHHARLGGWNG
jgi:putative DNA primase/helicase